MMLSGVVWGAVYIPCQMLTNLLKGMFLLTSGAFLSSKLKS